jgi:flagellar motor protein MotB
MSWDSLTVEKQGCRPGAEDKIKRIAAVLTQYGLDMRVEGHSDNVPIHNATFGSNWDLSTARAMAVATMLIDESGVDPKRMSIAGYAQYHPARATILRKAAELTGEWILSLCLFSSPQRRIRLRSQ